MQLDNNALTDEDEMTITQGSFDLRCIYHIYISLHLYQCIRSYHIAGKCSIANHTSGHKYSPRKT
jgi:hypothetical protein